jgi:MOSC domain-containing protein YiiM
VSIQTCPGKQLPMRPLESVQLIPGGIPGDKHFSPGSLRELLLIEEETLAEFGLAAGTVRENLTVRGLPLMALPEGTRLLVGDAELEITKICEPCSFIESLRPGLQAEFEGRRGMLARVLVAGAAKPGDAVAVLAGGQAGGSDEPLAAGADTAAP